MAVDDGANPARDVAPGTTDPAANDPVDGLTPALRTRHIKEAVLSEGFDLVGITSADVLDGDLARLRAWVRDGNHAAMGWLERDPERRADPGLLLDGARSVICLGLAYLSPNQTTRSPGAGKVASYAWGRDYHKVIGKRLKRLAHRIEAMAPGHHVRGFVDSGPILERAFARRAGLGFIGKNTMLIHRYWGSSFFLACLVTDLDLLEDEPVPRGCGQCTLCLDACPTGAFRGPFVLDSNRCLSYLTIEVRGDWPPGSPKDLHGWVFGCDECQSVCPYNRGEVPAVGAELASRSGIEPSMNLDEILRLNEVAFLERFQGSPLMRAKWRGLQRNARAILESDALDSGAPGVKSAASQAESENPDLGRSKQ